MSDIKTNLADVLSALGVSKDTLTAEEKQRLDEQGFVVFPNVLDGKRVNELRDRYESLMTSEGRSAGYEVAQEEGTRRLADLVNKGREFDVMYTHPKILAAVYHVIARDFKLSSLNGRDAVPGHGHQPFHADWHRRVLNEPYHVVNVIWMLDDFTADNGATRVVPGSHLLEGGPGDYMRDPGDPHPEQVLLLAPAGSVAVFNSHLWHGGTRNISSTTRRALFAYFTASEHPQQLNQKQYIRVETYNRISPEARRILDV